jgi:hypothetical protein
MARNVGGFRASHVLGFIVMWSLCRDELGHSPKPQEFSDWAGQSLATTYRDLEKFRAALPNESTPDRLLDVAAQHSIEFAKMRASWVGPS